MHDPHCQNFYFFSVKEKIRPLQVWRRAQIRLLVFGSIQCTSLFLWHSSFILETKFALYGIVNKIKLKEMHVAVAVEHLYLICNKWWSTDIACTVHSHYFIYICFAPDNRKIT